MKQKQLIISLIGANIATLGLGMFFWLSRPSSQWLTSGADAYDKKTGESLYLKEQVKNTIVKNSPSLQQCYIEFLAKKPKKEQASLKIDWHIDADGKPLGAQKISNELGADEPSVALEKCVIDKVSTWRFPEPPGGRKFYVAHKFFFGENKRMPPEMVNTHN